MTITADQPNLPAIVEAELPAPALRSGLPAAEYHRIRAVGSTRLNLLRQRSPAHVRHAIDHPTDPTPAMVLGSALHAAVLEPEAFDRLYVIADACAASTKAGKRCTNTGKALTADGWLCGVHMGDARPERPDVTILSADDAATVRAMRDALLSHPTAGRLLARRTDTELSATWTDAATGCPCKARFDAPLFRDGALLDLKKTTDASKSAVERTILNYGYDWQGRHYIDGAAANGVDVEHFWFAFVEEAPPHAVGLYRLTERNLQALVEPRRRLLATYAECDRTGVWPGYPDADDIEIPTWGMKQYENANH